MDYVMVTCEINLFQNHFNFRRHPFEITLFQRVETCLELFYNYFTGPRMFANLFSVAEIILK